LRYSRCYQSDDDAEAVVECQVRPGCLHRNAFVDDFVAIKARSQSLSRIDRTRLLRILDFIDVELADAGTFASLSREQYATRASLRRDLERWAENLVNASVDLARIVLASSGGRIPETYREAVRDLSVVPGFPRDDIDW
jgi:hypothetical protein